MGDGDGPLLQELSARLGVVTGRDLATIYAEYLAWLRLVIYVMMEIAVIGWTSRRWWLRDRVNFSGVIPVGRLPVTGVDTFTLAVQYLGALFEVLIAVLISAMTYASSSTGARRLDGAALATGQALPLLVVCDDAGGRHHRRRHHAAQPLPALRPRPLAED